MTNQKYKFDDGKPKYRLIPPAALKEIARALTYGEQKYSAHTWIYVESERYLDAAYRHIEAFRSGALYDSESGLPHLAMAATNIMFLIERQEGNSTLTKEQVKTYYDEIHDSIKKENDISKLPYKGKVGTNVF